MLFDCLLTTAYRLLLFMLPKLRVSRIIKTRRKNLPEDSEDTGLSFDTSPTRSEARAFTPDEMVACEKCRRANAPTRMNCLYCGAALPANEATATQRRPALRRLEQWEQGFNIVSLPESKADVANDALAQAASLLRLEASRVSEIVKARVALPLARASSREEAGLIEERLKTLGVAVDTVPDEWLAVETRAALRVRRLEFADGMLAGWSGANDESHVVAWSEWSLLVSGRLFTKRIETEERRTRLGMNGEMVDAREMTEDEGVIDLFDKSGMTNWRITSDGFDYSCLGARKSLLARENFVTLRETLRALAARVAFDDEYMRVRHLLAAAWPLAEHTEARGLRRERPGKFNVEASTVVSNEMQWTRYARLRNFYETKNSSQ